MTPPLNNLPLTQLEDYPKGARKLILTAERLFGQQGIDTVSLRQIVSSAGQANNYAVQHHFGSKEGLISAIFTLRTVTLDESRKKYLEKINTQENPSAKDIIEAIMLPILEAFDEEERQLHADFMFQLFHRNKMNSNSLLNGDSPIYEEVAPAINSLNQILREKLGHLPADIFNIRYRLAAELFLSGLNESKRIVLNESHSYHSQHKFWTDILLLSVAIFEAPYPAI